MQRADCLLFLFQGIPSWSLPTVTKQQKISSLVGTSFQPYWSQFHLDFSFQSSFFKFVQSYGENHFQKHSNRLYLEQPSFRSADSSLIQTKSLIVTYWLLAFIIWLIFLAICLFRLRNSNKVLLLQIHQIEFSRYELTELLSIFS